jgi:hypothetical protein
VPGLSGVDFATPFYFRLPPTPPIPPEYGYLKPVRIRLDIRKNNVVLTSCAGLVAGSRMQKTRLGVSTENPLDGFSFLPNFGGVDTLFKGVRFRLKSEFVGEAMGKWREYPRFQTISE